MLPLVAVVQVRITNKTFTSRRRGCPLSLDIYTFPRGDLCTDEGKWVTCRKHLHFPWVQVCMIIV